MMGKLVYILVVVFISRELRTESKCVPQDSSKKCVFVQETEKERKKSKPFHGQVALYSVGKDETCDDPNLRNETKSKLKSGPRFIIINNTGNNQQRKHCLAIRLKGKKSNTIFWKSSYVQEYDRRSNTWTEMDIPGDSLDRPRNFACYDQRQLLELTYRGTKAIVLQATRFDNQSNTYTILSNQNFIVHHRQTSEEMTHLQWFKLDHASEWKCAAKRRSECPFEWVKNVGTANETVVTTSNLKIQDIEPENAVYHCRSSGRSTMTKRYKQSTRSGQTSQGLSPPLTVDAGGDEHVYAKFDVSWEKIQEVMDMKLKHCRDEIDKQRKKATEEEADHGDFLIYFFSMLGGMVIISLIVVIVGLKKESRLAKDDLDWTEATDSLKEVESEIELEQVMTKLCGKREERGGSGSPAPAPSGTMSAKPEP